MMQTHGVRVCSKCGNNWTHIGGTNMNGLWHRDGNNGWWCQNCYQRNISFRRFMYKNKQIYLNKNPRICVCNFCRAVTPFDTAYTQRAHISSYHDDNPLKNTLELCVKCHGKNDNPIEPNRVCCECGSQKTYIDKKTGTSLWCMVGKNQYVCGRCYYHWCKKHRPSEIKRRIEKQRYRRMNIPPKNTKVLE